MPLYRPTELRAFLDSIGAAPKKSLSQNFLIDGNIIKKIGALAELKPGDSVLEIGPGPGALTEELLEIGCRVIAVEKDRAFAAALPRLGNVEVICDDVLNFDFESLPEGTKVVANIPYNLTSPIIEKCLHSKRIQTAVLMVQKELGERILAKGGTREFSSLSLFVQFHAIATFGFLVHAGSFYPRPSIDSVVIRLDFHNRFPDIDQKAFEKVARSAFQERRKTLSKSLRELYPAEKVQMALESLGLNPKARPEELSLEEWVAFFRALRS